MLVVIDDPAMRVLLGDVLERAGFAVTVEEASEVVIAAGERTRFDAVVPASIPSPSSTTVLRGRPSF